MLFTSPFYDLKFCSYTQIKNSDKEKRKATEKVWSWELSTVTLLRLQLHMNLNVSSSSDKNGLLRSSGLHLQYPVIMCSIGHRHTIPYVKKSAFTLDLASVLCRRSNHPEFLPCRSVLNLPVHNELKLLLKPTILSNAF